MNDAIPIQDFLKMPGTAFDVRSEGEFQKGHLPGSLNLPLFNNEERALVGTCYKKEGKTEAFLLGLKFAGPKFASFTETALKHCEKGPCKVLCWRGGMRSQSISWLFKTAGLQTFSLVGGYKAFRKWVLETFERPFELKMLGGLTGSGKTDFLKKLSADGEQVLDLESLANHRGSAFGAFGMPLQGTVEHFENSLAVKLASFDLEKPIWVEDESRLIGNCIIPKPFFQMMQTSPLFFLECPKEKRIEKLVKEYGRFEKEFLIRSVLKISKRLGGARTKEIVSSIEEDLLSKAANHLLEYYDAAYNYGLKKRKTVTTLEKGLWT